MKVLSVNTHFDAETGGGGAERTIQMSRSLQRHGIACTILTTGVHNAEPAGRRMGGINVVALPCLCKRFYIPQPSLGTIRSLVEEADVIHLMAHWSVLNAIVQRYARKLGKPYVVCSAGTLSIYGRSRLIKRVYNWAAGNSIIRNASGLIAVSKEELPHYAAYGVSDDRVAVIPNGVDVDDFSDRDTDAFRKKYGLENHPFMLFVGRLNAIKGPDLLLRAFCEVAEKLKEHHLVFAGADAGMLGDLEKLTDEHGMRDRVHFVGSLSAAERSRAYHAADLLAIPSRQEAMSIVVLEAGVTGTPVLITDKCGFDEVRFAGGGMVVRDSVEALKAGLLDMLNNETDLKAMGERLKTFTCKNYLWDSIIRKHLELFEQILRN